MTTLYTLTELQEKSGLSCGQVSKIMKGARPAGKTRANNNRLMKTYRWDDFQQRWRPDNGILTYLPAGMTNKTDIEQHLRIGYKKVVEFSKHPNFPEPEGTYYHELEKGGRAIPYYSIAKLKRFANTYGKEIGKPKGRPRLTLAKRVDQMALFFHKTLMTARSAA